MNQEIEQLKVENRRLKKRYKDQDRLWTLADQDNCDGDCDLEPPHKECPECLARSVINECGEIFGNVLSEIDNLQVR